MVRVYMGCTDYSCISLLFLLNPSFCLYTYQPLYDLLSVTHPVNKRLIMLSVLPTLILALLPLSSALRVPLDLDASLNTASSLSSDARVQVENTAHRLFAGEIDLATAVKHYTNLKLDSRSTILDVDLNAATDVDVYLQTKLRQALDLQAKIHAEAQAKADAKGKAKVATRTVGISLPDIYAGASFCVTLASDLQISNSVTLSAGTCICVDAAVAGGLQGPVTVYTSSGATFTGELAVKIRDSVSRLHVHHTKTPRLTCATSSCLPNSAHSSSTPLPPTFSVFSGSCFRSKSLPMSVSRPTCFSGLGSTTLPKEPASNAVPEVGPPSPSFTCLPTPH